MREEIEPDEEVWKDLPSASDLVSIVLELGQSYLGRPDALFSANRTLRLV